MSSPEDIISTVGTVVLGLFLASQLPSFWHVFRVTKSVANLSYAPTLGQGANFICWVAYGLIGQQPTIMRVNAVRWSFIAQGSPRSSFASLRRALRIGAF